MTSSLWPLEPYRPTGWSTSQDLYPRTEFGDADDYMATECSGFWWWDVLPNSCQQAKFYDDVDGSYKEKVLNDIIEMEMELSLRRSNQLQQQQREDLLSPVGEQLTYVPFIDNDSCLAGNVDANDSVENSRSSSSSSSSSSSVGMSSPTSGNDDDTDDDEDSDSEQSPPASPSARRTRSQTGRPVRPRNRKRQLYLFLKEILDNPDYNPTIITWVAPGDNIFRFVQPKSVAELWGRRRNRDGMTYEHLSRAMRYYYSRGVMRRAPNHGRLVYQFL